ncbi:tRNA (guanine(37)-N1)-methyltransferase 1 [Rhodamnia argentea]|uniref:tRNA (guanine(37)-N1)-methyltransferase n=1 Tax=Rhodamnia argentea TaxID=178133 RepID=A0A8B8QTT2_9MYRT|nr:tRNA (guanine(37)-N1)-methyltransferase 1 [Rhodamnia argentea]
MVAKFLLKPYHRLSFPILPSTIRLAPHSKPSSILFTITSRAAAAAATDITQLHAAGSPLPYGPSLQKGTIPSQSFRDFNQEEACEDSLDEESFARVFRISALRVPSKDCFALENRLRGHLLNWPRVCNVARVPGDEVEDDVAELIGSRNGSRESGEVEGFETLGRRIYGKAEGDGEPLSGVLYRERLAKTFNSQGFVNFRNLAKISRPKKRKKREANENRDENRDGNREGGVKRNKFAVVEVIEDEEREGEDLRGLLGDEFKGRRWRGSTRLLLLDDSYAEKCLEDLPEAVKAVLKEGQRDGTSSVELVSCTLTLFYDYWSMNEILEALLPKGMIVPSAFETVGHIAHLNLREEHLPYKKLIAKVILDKNKPKIQTVVNKIDMIHSDYRTMQLEVLAGNYSLVTTVVENGLRFSVDLATVYWNSRLATERQRLLSGFTRNDVVCDVFCGVGPIAISAAKIVKRVYANDLNPDAIEYLERNIVLNKLDRKIQVFNMDGRRFIKSLFASEKALSITQVVMNLPNDAAEFLDAFRGIYGDKPKGMMHALPVIHVYGFSKARDPEFDFHERIRIALSEVAVQVEMRRVRLVAPGKWMLCATFTLPQSVAFARTMAFKDQI